MRRAHNLDANHAEVVAAFRALGCSVLSLAGVGNGCPDLLVGVAGRNHLVEVKDGGKPKSKRALTPLEQEFAQRWRGCVVEVVEGPDKARALVSQWRGVQASEGAWLRHTDDCLLNLADPGASCVCRPPAVAEPLVGVPTPNVKRSR